MENFGNYEGFKINTDDQILCCDLSKLDVFGQLINLWGHFLFLCSFWG